MIENKLKNQVEAELSRLNQYFLETDDTENNIGLYMGMSGSCLLLSLNYLTSGNEIYYEKLGSLLNKINDFINENPNPDPSFSSGLAGWGWLIEYMSQKGILGTEADLLLSDVDIYLSSRMKAMLLKHNLDQLNGALGIGRYFMKRGKKDEVLTLLTYLEQHKIESGDEIKWRRENWRKAGTYFYDFSLAHGVTGIIQFLISCFRNNIEKERCSYLIAGGARFLIHNRQPFEEAGSFFPGIINFEDYQAGVHKNAQSRLAWCYGDLTIFYILLDAADVLEDEELRELAIAGLLKNTLRTSFEETSVIDAGFCHGASGIIHVFNKIWRKTNIENFLRSSEFWLEQTLAYSSGKPAEEGYEFLVGNFEERSLKSCSTLLEGSTGVALAYLSYLNPEISDWDESMLL
ncbi:lanthionine synthetase C family protein [Pedobacter sp. WC2423]|uniref:lanthionine synthetase C family protein n=1 Tax=Pedobacter sp. WC2423 TaxID=3234142 RepID=UPI003466533A